MASQIKYFRLLVFMMMITTFLPVVGNHLPPIIGSPHFFNALWLLSLIMLAPKVFSKKMMKLIILYGLFLVVMRYLVWTHMPTSINYDVWQDYYYIAVGVSVIVYFQSSNDYYGLALISKWSFIFIIITAAITIIVSLKFGTSARLLMYGDSPDAIHMKEIITKYGSGSYATCIVFMSIIPLIIYYTRNRYILNINNWLLIASIVLISLAIIRLQLFTNFIFLIILLLLSLFNFKKPKDLLLTVTIIAIILLAIPKDFINSSLVDISNFLSGKFDELSSKIYDLSVYLKFGSLGDSSNSVVQRSSRYPILWNAFLQHPIFGCDVSPISYYLEANETYHLYWLNKLATTGIINTFFILYILYSYIVDQRKRLSQPYFICFLLSALSVILYGVFKVTGGREAWFFLFIIAPGLYYLPIISGRTFSVPQHSAVMQS